MSRYMNTEKAINAVAVQMDELNAEIDRLTDELALADVKIEKLELTKYAPPAIEVIDGIASDKSQDADWLRARYFEGSARIDSLESRLRECLRLAEESLSDFSGDQYKWLASIAEVARG